MYEAIMASLLDHTDSNAKKVQQERENKDEKRILLEIVQLSKLENDKNNGKLNLNQLKRQLKRDSSNQGSNS